MNINEKPTYFFSPCSVYFIFTHHKHLVNKIIILENRMLRNITNHLYEPIKYLQEVLFGSEPTCEIYVTKNTTDSNQVKFKTA